MNVYRGDLATAAPGQRYAIAVARFNEEITRRLLDGAVETLKKHGVADDAIDVAWTPGAFELPLVADRMATSGRYAAVLCLGAVIRGETSHDQHINRAVSLGITEAGLRSGVPVIFGVLTCENYEQAEARSGGNVEQGGPNTGGKKKTVDNKGVECAEAALEMVSLLKKLEEE